MGGPQLLSVLDEIQVVRRVDAFPGSGRVLRFAFDARSGIGMLEISGMEAAIEGNASDQNCSQWFLRRFQSML